MEKIDNLLQNIYKIKADYRDLSTDHWLNMELFTWPWWVSFIFAIVPILLWYKLVDKRRMLEITAFGLMINAAASFLDVFGTYLMLWDYPIRLLPFGPALFPVDYIFLPVCNMFIYQYYNNWKSFIIAQIIFSAVLSFALEPLAVVIGLYVLFTWEYVYSFPIYIVIAIVSRWMTQSYKKTKIKAST